MKTFSVQYTYSAPVEEYSAMVYVKRRDTFHVDSSPDLYGEAKALVLRHQRDYITSALIFLHQAPVNSLHHCLMLWLLPPLSPQ